MSTRTFARVLLPLLFITAFSVYSIVEVGRRPRILVVHSYAPGYSWTDNVSVGIRRVLAKHSYAVRWHHMDTKNHPDDDFKQRAAHSVCTIIDSWAPNVIITIDDNAQYLVARHYLNRKDMSIVFAGVGGDPADYFRVGSKHYAQNVTGILETMPLEHIRNTIIDLFKNRKRSGPIRVFSISDSSQSGKTNRDQILAYDWGAQIQLTTKMVDHFGQWKEALKAQEGKQDLLFFTNYHTIRKVAGGDEVQTPESIIRWTLDNIDLPGLGGWGYFVEHGGMLAVGPSPYEQGEWAANTAHQIIETGKIACPVNGNYARPKHFLVSMRGSELKKRGFHVSPVLEAFARATDNYFEGAGSQ